MKYQNVNLLRIMVICFTILFLGSISASITHAETYSYVTQWGSMGNSTQPFNNSVGSIAVDSSDNVYVSGVQGHEFWIQKFDSHGNFITKWENINKLENIEGYFCCNLATDSSGNLYKGSCNDTLYAVTKFDSNGNILKQWKYQDKYNKYSALINGFAVDSNGNVFIIDGVKSLVMKFDSNGNFLKQIKEIGIEDIAVDLSGNVYVVTSSSTHIRKYDNDLNFINGVGFGGGMGIAVDFSKNIYVSTSTDGDIYKLDNNFNVITEWSPHTTGLIGVYSDIAVDSSDNVYFLDKANNYVKKFSPNNLVANFTNETNDSDPLSIQFNDTSIGSPTSWYWDFGDGNNSTEQNPVYTYDTPGSYTVTLTASNAKGADSFSQEIKVRELNFDVNPSKIRISDNVEFDAYKYTDELHGNIFWEFGDGTYDESGNSIVTHNYSKPGFYNVNLSVRDSDNVERKVSKTINVTIPVVLVHGWKSSSDTWKSMSDELQKNGFEVWNFDYRDFNTADPRTVSRKLAAFIEEKRNDLSYNGQKYNGKIDIICHSMGAIVSRLYMEKDDGGIHGKDVRQWIGIAPAHKGSAFADLNPAPTNYYELLFHGTAGIDIIFYAIKLKYLGPAVDELKTTSDSVKSLGALSPSTKYWVLAGWNPKHSLDFGDGWLSATRAKATSGTSSTYYWTYSGDMIIATEQSYDDRMEFEAFPPVNGNLGDSPAHEFDHTHICSSPKVIAYVIDCIKNINKHSTKQKPPKEEVSLFNSFMKIISGKLGTAEQYVDIPVSVVPIGSNNGANLLMATSSGSVSASDTSSSSENMLSTTLEWGEGDITMTLTSPSGIEYSEDSHPHDVWYTKNGNSISYIVTAPESGNWTAKLIPTKYPDHDIQYNLTYLIRTINVSGSSILPVANFSSNITEGYTPLDVQFTNLSTNATDLQWNFGDGSSNVSDANPVHVFTSTGLFNVVLTASNGNGSDSKFSTINVLTPVQRLDVEKPVIQSAILYPANTIAGSKINITVNATDNIGVIGVTAGNVQLTNTGSLWQGTITAPSKIGSYSLSINASDAAGNSAAKTANYKVVSPTGSLGVGISPKTTAASTSGKTIDYTVKIKSIQNFDDVVRVKVTMDGLPVSYQVPLEWFNWNNQTVNVASNSTISLPLRLTIPPGQSVGRKAFKVSANSTSWITTAFDSGVITIS